MVTSRNGVWDGEDRGAGGRNQQESKTENSSILARINAGILAKVYKDELAQRKGNKLNTQGRAR